MHPKHNPEQVITKGAGIPSAEKVVIAIHGRGATAQSILSLSDYFDTDKTHWVAPQAAGNTWYPYSFMEPREKNEPWLTSALTALDSICDLARKSGIKNDKIFFLGFSQGACLALEYAAQRAQHFGGVIAFSGGLIGPEIEPGYYTSDLKGTPVFIGCSDHDFHIPEERVHASADMLRKIGADCEAVIYPGLGHTINEDEIRKAGKILGEGT